jgi:hypothetical protein
MPQFDVRKWIGDLAAKGKFTPEETKLLEDKLGKPEVAQLIGEGQLRQQEFDRKLNALKTDFDKKNQELTAYHGRLSTFEKSAQETLSSQDKQLQAERTARVRYEEKLKGLAREYGLDEATLIQQVEVSPAQPAKPDPAPQPAPGERFEKFQSDVATAMMQMPLVQAEIIDLAAEHQQLGLKTPFRATELVSESIERKVPLRQVWEEKFSVSDRRQELATADQKAHDDLIRREERERILTERDTPSLRPEASRSPILATLPGRFGQSSEEPKLSAVDRAVKAYTMGHDSKPEARP